jgi:uncharacterized iron-regulated membrane protein
MALDTRLQPITIAAEGSDQPAAPRTDAVATKAARQRSNRLYALIWRWHFLAGLLVTPILITVALMGSLYVFKDELEPLFHPRLLTVTPQPSEASLAAQLAAVKAAYPTAKITTISHHADPARSASFSGRTADDAKLTVYVNQYSGAVLGQLDEASGFFGIVLKIHRQLFAGTFGRIVVELMVCWSISSMLSGLYLGWKRIRKDGWRWRPRLRGQSSRSLLRELHIYGGLYLGVTALLIMVTGLLFTSVTGDLIKDGLAATGQTPAVFASPPKSQAQDGGQAISPDAALTAYQASGATAEWRMQLPAKDTASYAFTANTSAQLGDYRRAWIDQYSGAVLANIRWSDLPLGTKITRYFYPIHTGAILGLPTKILALLTCLLLITLSVTGVQMWWKRRPAGKLGVPARVGEPVVPKAMVALIVIMAVLMPLMGASLLLVLVGDWLTRRVGRRRGPQPAA